MSLYPGTFTVENKTGYTIHDVVVSQRVKTGIDQWSQAASLKTLADGATTQPYPFRSADGENDYWDVVFTIDYGPQKGRILYYREGKQCNYESSNSPKNCKIVLMVDKFSIITPVTSACLDNYLDHRFA